MDTLNILLVNDDGIDAPGLLVLAEAAARFGRVWIVAPATQCSGMSQQITIREDMPIVSRSLPVDAEEAWSLGGTPADCVKAAVSGLLPVKPDLLFSGINNGYNAGLDVAYSGTIGAALEGLSKGIPALAFSAASDKDLRLAEKALPALITELLAMPIEPHALWNVNFPACPPEACKGILRRRKLAPTQAYLDSYRYDAHPDGTIRMRLTGRPVPAELAPEGTDIHALYNDYISIGKVYSTVLAS